MGYKLPMVTLPSLFVFAPGAVSAPMMAIIISAARISR